MDKAKKIAAIGLKGDTLSELKVKCQQEGYEVIGKDLKDIKAGGKDINGFIDETKPQIVLWDIPKMNDQSWQEAESLLKGEGAKDIHFIFTSQDTDQIQGLKDIGFGNKIKIVPESKTELIQTVTNEFKQIEQEGKFKGQEGQQGKYGPERA